MIQCQEEKNFKKITNPLLLFLRRGAHSSRKEKIPRGKDKKRINQHSPRDLDRMESFGITEDNEVGLRTDFIPKENKTFSDILGSSDLSVSPYGSEKCSIWTKTVSDFGRNLSSQSRRLSASSDISRRPSLSSDNSRRPSNSSFSSSYTSWTKPIAGQKISDSFCPASSILDKDDQNYSCLERSGVGIHEDLDSCDRSRRKLKRMGSKRLRRNSSADTSKDIEDIDDFELDVLDEGGLTNDEEIVFTVYKDIEDVKDKRLSGTMSSPDLAYGSMNGSFDNQDEDA